MKRQSIVIAGLALSTSLTLAACQESKDAAGPSVPVAASSGTPAGAAGSASSPVESAQPGASATSAAPSSSSAAGASDDSSAGAESGAPGATGKSASSSNTQGSQGDSGSKATTSSSGLTLDGLKSAPYPAMCQNPAGTLKNGKNMRGHLGNVEANMPGVGMKYYNAGSKPALVDLTGDGRKEMVVEFFCDAGGVTWPSVIVVYGQDWKVLGTIDLAYLANKDAFYGKARVTSWSAGRSGLNVTWKAFQPLEGSTDSRRTGVIRVRGGKPVMTDVVVHTGHGASTGGDEGGDNGGGPSVSRTQIRSINPVVNGKLAAGWTSTKTGESCDGSESSIVARSSGIFICGANAAGYDACWALADHQAACVASPYRKHVDLLNLTKPTTAHEVANEVPWGVVLADGTTCQPFFGGGGRVRADGYITRYFCDDNRELLMRENDGGLNWFDKGNVWTVQVSQRGLDTKRTTAQVKAVSYAVR